MASRCVSRTLFLFCIVFHAFELKATSAPSPPTSKRPPSSAPLSPCQFLGADRLKLAFMHSYPVLQRRRTSTVETAVAHTKFRAVRRSLITPLRAELDASVPASIARETENQLSPSTSEEARRTREFAIRRARPEEVELAASLSMQAFYGLRNLNPFDASQVFRLYRNAEGEAFNALQYLWQRSDLERRLRQSTQRQEEVGAQEPRSSAEEASSEAQSDAAAPGQAAPSTNIAAVFFAEDAASGQVVGMVELIALPYPALPQPQKPYLFNLCVEEAFRNQGVGRKLVRRCEEEAVALGHDLLWLHTETEATREVYTRLRYRPTHQKPSWVELHLLNKVVADFDAEGSRRDPKGWVIMARELEGLL